MASIISVFEAYLPVPTKRRERNSRPAIVSGKGSRDASTVVALVISAATNEVDNLYDVPVGESVSREGFAIAKDRAVVLDYDEARIDAKRSEELCDCAIPRNLPGGAVHRQRDDLARFRGTNHRSKYSG